MMMSLWLPIVASAIAVFIVSAVLNAALPWHKNDFRRVPEEDGVRNALRPFAIARGEYMVPRCDDPKEMNTPEFKQKMTEGPVFLMTVLENRPMGMGRPLTLWFIYCLIVSATAGCITHAALGIIHTNGGTIESHSIFHFAAIAAFLSYAVALWQNSIWYGRPWSTTLKSTIDGVVYAAITGGIFVWLWP